MKHLIFLFLLLSLINFLVQANQNSCLDGDIEFCPNDTEEDYSKIFPDQTKSINKKKIMRKNKKRIIKKVFQKGQTKPIVKKTIDINKVTNTKSKDKQSKELLNKTKKVTNDSQKQLSKLSNNKKIKNKVKDKVKPVKKNDKKIDPAQDNVWNRLRNKYKQIKKEVIVPNYKKAKRSIKNLRDIVSEKFKLYF